MSTTQMRRPASYAGTPIESEREHEPFGIARRARGFVDELEETAHALEYAAAAWLPLSPSAMSTGFIVARMPCASRRSARARGRRPAAGGGGRNHTTLTSAHTTTKPDRADHDGRGAGGRITSERRGQGEREERREQEAPVHVVAADRDDVEDVDHRAAKGWRQSRWPSGDRSADR